MRALSSSPSKFDKNVFLVIGFPHAGNMTPNFSQPQVSRQKSQSTSEVNHGGEFGCAYVCNGHAQKQRSNLVRPAYGMSPFMASPAHSGRKGKIDEVCDQGKADKKIPPFANSQAKQTNTDDVDICEPLEVVEIQGNVVEFHAKL